MANVLPILFIQKVHEPISNKYWIFTVKIQKFISLSHVCTFKNETEDTKRDNQNSQERQTKTRLKQKTKKNPTTIKKKTLKNWATPGIRACAPVHLDSYPVGKLTVPGKPCLCKEGMPSKFTTFSYKSPCRVNAWHKHLYVVIQIDCVHLSTFTINSDCVHLCC